MDTGAGGNATGGGDVTQKSNTNQTGDHNSGAKARFRPLTALVPNGIVTCAMVVIRKARF